MRPGSTRGRRLVAILTAGSVVGWASSRSMLGGLVTARAETGSVSESVDVGGQLRPVTSIPLDFGAPGSVLNVRVAAGEHVSRGEMLATLDASSLATQLGQAQAALTAATARLVQDSKAPSGLRTAQGAVAGGGQQVGSTQRALNDARRAGAVNVNGSQLTLQQTQTTGQGALNAAQSQVATAQANLADTQRVGTSNVVAAQVAAQSAVAQAQTTVDSDTAQLLAAQRNLADSARTDEAKIRTAAATLQADRGVLQVTEQALAADQAQLSRDQARVESDCGSSHSSSACSGDQQVVSTDRQTVSSDAQAVAQARAGVETSQAALLEAQSAAQQDRDQGQAQVSAATVALRDAQAALAVAVHSGQAAVAQAQAQAQQAIDQAQGQLAASQIEAQNRQAALQAAVAVGRNDVAKAQIEALQGTDQAQSLLDAASIELGTSQAVLGDLQGVTIPQTVITDEGAVQSAQQQVVDAQHLLDGATLVAPIDGVISEVNIAPGESLAPQSGGSSNASNTAGPGPAVVSHAIVLSTTGAYEVDVTSTDARLGSVRIGQSVQVHPRGSSQTLEGTVTKITRVGSTATAVPTYALTVVVAARGLAGPLGPDATVTVVAEHVTGAVTVPSSAVITDGATSFVLLSADAHLTPHVVAVAARNDSRAAILAGVQLNDMIVVRQAPLPAGTAARLGTAPGVVEEEEEEDRTGTDTRPAPLDEDGVGDVDDIVARFEAARRSRSGRRRNPGWRTGDLDVTDRDLPAPSVDPDGWLT